MNVVVIVNDTWHINYLGCYGNDWIETPNLDAFSRRAIAFDNAYPENLPTLPTRTSWWTGRWGFPSRPWQPLPLNEIVLPEALWSQNVRSALVTDVYHMHRPGFGYGRGFDEVYRIRGQEYDAWIREDECAVDLAASPHHRLPEGIGQREMWKERFEQYLRNRSRLQEPEDFYIAQVVQRGCRWLDENRDREQPKFLWMDCFDPHEPWDPPEPWLSMYVHEDDRNKPVLVDPVPGRVGEVIEEDEIRRLRATYAAELTFVDHWLGKLFETLERCGYFEDTLIWWMTDHGQPLGEHGIVRKCRPWLHEELVHTPWLVHLPGDERAGQRCPAFVQAPDVMPTILEFLDAPIPDSVQGTSLLPLFRGQVSGVHDAAYLGMGQAEWGMRTEDWSFLLPRRAPQPGDPPRGIQLYNRHDDPGEHRNLAAELPEVAAELELRLRRFADEASTGARQPGQAHDPAGGIGKR